MVRYGTGGGEGGDVAKIKYKKKVDLKGNFFSIVHQKPLFAEKSNVRIHINI